MGGWMARVRVGGPDLADRIASTFNIMGLAIR